MEDIDNIADYFIWFSNEHGDLLTHLKLQKLCYFAEVFFIAHKNQPLTGEHFEAWIHEPVSKKLWDRLKKYGINPVNKEISPLYESGEEEYARVKPKISEDHRIAFEKNNPCVLGTFCMGARVCDS